MSYAPSPRRPPNCRPWAGPPRRWCDCGAQSLAEGTVLVGVPGIWADRFRAVYATERLNLLTARYAAELDAGNHESVLGELIALNQDEPFAEALTGHLMLAYHRSGRSAEALACYEGLRTRLRDSLGADPSAALRRLHVQILDHDVDLEPATALPAPSMLPAGVGGFVGRRRESTALTEALTGRGGSPLAVVAGPGGAGKTALAVHWGRAHQAEFPDGRLYVDLRGFDRHAPLPPRDALSRLLLALGHPADAVPSDVDLAAELYRASTAGRRMLVVLDNARDAEQVRPLLPGDGCATLVTSRDRLTGLIAVDHARIVPVSLLPADEAVDVLASVLGPRRIAAEPEAAARLAERCGFLPLALRIAAANLAVRPVASIGAHADALGGAGRLDLLSIPGDRRATVSANLEISYRALPPDARDLLCRLGSLPVEDVARGLAASVAGLPEAEFAAALGALHDGHLVEEHREDRHRMHDLVRLYAAARAETDLPEDERSRTIDAFIDWQHDRAYGPEDEEENNILLACSHLGEHPRLWRLVVPLRKSMNAGRSLDRVGGVAATALRLAERDFDEAGAFQMSKLLAAVHRKAGDLPAALRLGRKAVDMAAALGPREQAAAQGNLGAFLAASGDTRGAAETLGAAMDLAIATGNTRSQFIIVESLVATLLKLGEHARARRHLDAVTAGIEAFNPVERASLRLFAGTILVDEERFEEALAVIEESLAFALREGSTFLELRCLIWQGRALRRMGRLAEARRAHTAELALNRRHGRAATEFDTLCSLAQVDALRGDPTSAEHFLAEARAHTKHAETAWGEAQLQLTGALIHGARGEHREAIAGAGAALASYTAMAWLQKQAECLRVQANAHDALGEFEQAHRCREQATRSHRPGD
ncbi:BTAD domain-containing putative transcriptional regulator [Phytomonospora sp. NPDC050363]|uniref:ATP-binding protein n=1 Tax=Phytomonospora sp. NPDC050363 TaxID=3155642 RepID=UPI0033C3614B